MPRAKKNRASKRAVQFQSFNDTIGYTTLKRAREYVLDGRARWIEIDSIMEFIPGDYRHLAAQRSMESDQQARAQQLGYEIQVEEGFAGPESMRTFAPYPETGVEMA